MIVNELNWVHAGKIPLPFDNGSRLSRGMESCYFFLPMTGPQEYGFPLRRIGLKNGERISTLSGILLARHTG